MPPFYHLLIMSSRRCKDYIAETFPCYIDYNQSTNQYFLKRYHQYGQDDSLYNYLFPSFVTVCTINPLVR